MGTALKISRFVAVLTVCSLFLAPSKSKADDTPVVHPYVIALYGEFVIIPVGIISGIGNLYYVTQGEQAPTGWEAAGIASGVVNIFVGVFWLASDFEKDSFPFGIGITNIVLGTLDIGFTIWASLQPEKKEQKLTLAPMIMPDARGRPAFGVGLRLVDW